MAAYSTMKAEMENDERTREWLNLLGLITATSLGLFLTYLLAAPFLSSLTTALALSVLLMPLHRAFERGVHRASLAAALTVIVALLIIFVPVSLVGQRLVAEATIAADAASFAINSGSWRNIVSTNDHLASAVAWIEQRLDLPHIVDNASNWLAATAPTIVRGSGEQIVATIVTFYLLFYMVRDRRHGLSVLAAISPLSRRAMAELYARIADTIRATVFGTFAVSFIQGTLGGLMFWALGLPSPLLWSLIMGLAAVIPVLGTFIVWLPAAAFLAVSGHEGKAVIMLLWGMIVVGGIDNLVYPMLVGDRLKMHTIPAFISLVGGLIVFGPAGLILGPVIMTTTNFLLQHWRGADRVDELPSAKAARTGS